MEARLLTVSASVLKPTAEAVVLIEDKRGLHKQFLPGVGYNRALVQAIAKLAEKAGDGDCLVVVTRPDFYLRAAAAGAPRDCQVPETPEARLYALATAGKVRFDYALPEELDRLIELQKVAKALLARRHPGAKVFPGEREQ